VIRRYAVTVAGQARAVEIEELPGGELRAVVEGRETRMAPRSVAAGQYLWLEGSRVVVTDVQPAGGGLAVTARGHTLMVDVADAQSRALAAVATRAPGKAGPLIVRAPMPGRLVKVLVKAGEQAAAGKPLLVIEAMKMENEIRAPRDGRVRELRAAEGSTVEANQELLVLE
jgi:biotin carboxyl carrier protein